MFAGDCNLFVNHRKLDVFSSPLHTVLRLFGLDGFVQSMWPEPLTLKEFVSFEGNRGRMRADTCKVCDGLLLTISVCVNSRTAWYGRSENKNL